MEIIGLTVDRLHEALRARATSVREVCARTLERIEALNRQLGAFLTINRDEALRRAEELDGELARGDWRPLMGVPVAVKDNICTRGLRTTCASKILHNFVPPLQCDGGRAVAGSRSGHHR